MREAGRDLLRDEWPELIFEHSFNTASGTTEYALPASPSLDRIINDTAYDRSQFDKLFGPISYEHLSRERHDGITRAEIVQSWRLGTDASRVKRFVFTDDPGGTFEVRYFYATKQWLHEPSSGYVEDITADTNIPLFDDYLFELETKWRVLRALGLPYGDEALSARQVRDERLARDNGRIVHLSRPRIDWLFAARSI